MDKRDKSKDDTRRVPIIGDGVGYTPSGADDFDYDFDPDAGNTGDANKNAEPEITEDAGKTKKIATATPKKQGTTQKQAAQKQLRKAPKKAHYTIFLVTTVFVSVIAVVFVFALIINSLGSDSPSGPIVAGTVANNADEDYEVMEQEDLIIEDGELAFVAVVQATNPTSRRLDLYVLQTNQLRSFFVESSSSLRDKFGNAVDITYFSPGDVLEVVHEADSTVIEIARISAQVRTYPNVRDVMIDAENDMLMIGMRQYPFTMGTIVMYHDEQNTIFDIDPVDIVSVNVLLFEEFAGHVAFVEIHQSSGAILIPENDMIINGTVEIAGTALAGLDGDEMELRVPEGNHRVTIRGLNIEIFEYELTVTRGGVSVVDLSGLTILSGSLTIYADDPYVVLTIDGEEHDINEMIMLEYGVYEISVTRDGFVPFTQDVTIDSANHEITVVLEEIILTQNVTIITVPTGARIYVDYEYMGLSPISLELEQRRHTVTTALEGYESTTSDIWVTENPGPPITWVLPPVATQTQQDTGPTPPPQPQMATPEPVSTPTPMPGPTPTPTPFHPASPTPSPLYPEISPSPSPAS